MAKALNNMGGSRREQYSKGEVSNHQCDSKSVGQHPDMRGNSGEIEDCLRQIPYGVRGRGYDRRCGVSFDVADGLCLKGNHQLFRIC